MGCCCPPRQRYNGPWLREGAYPFGHGDRSLSDSEVDSDTEMKSKRRKKRKKEKTPIQERRLRDTTNENEQTSTKDDELSETETEDWEVKRDWSRHDVHIPFHKSWAQFWSRDTDERWHVYLTKSWAERRKRHPIATSLQGREIQLPSGKGVYVHKGAYYLASACIHSKRVIPAELLFHTVGKDEDTDVEEVYPIGDHLYTNGTGRVYARHKLANGTILILSSPHETNVRNSEHPNVWIAPDGVLMTNQEIPQGREIVKSIRLSSHHL